MRNILLFFILSFFTVNCLAEITAMHDLTIVPPVVVKKPISYSQTNSTKTLITSEEMSNVGITSLSQALQTLGGVQLQDTSGNGSQILISMRGFGANASSNTLLLVNGIPITNPDIAPPDLNMIPFQEIKYIEVISGSESVLYGDQAVGGVINVVTQNPEKNKIIASCSGGTYDSHNCSADINASYKQWNYSLGVLNQHTDNYREHNNYDQNLLSGRINHDYQSSHWKLDYTFANERLLYPGALTAEQVAENRRQSTNDTDFFKDSNATIHLNEEQIITSNWKVITDIERRQMFGSGVLFSPFRQSRIIHYVKPQVKGNINNILLNGGFDYEHDQYNLTTDFGITDDSMQKYGIFGLATIPTPKQTALIIGARGAKQTNQLNEGSDIDTINRAFASTIGLTFFPMNNIKAYIRRAGSFRFPKADEEASTPPGVNGLKTQRGDAYEAGIDSHWEKLKSQFSIYQLNLRDEIAFDPLQTPDRPFGTNTNYSPTTRQGFTLSEKYALTEKIILDGEYHFVNAQFQNGIYAGKQIPLVSENIVHGGINYSFLPHWNLYTETVYTGSQYSANDNANIAGKIGGYTTYNMNVRFLYQAFTASFRINNIFNKYYYLYTTFEPSMDEQFFYPAPCRNILLTLKYELS